MYHDKTCLLFLMFYCGILEHQVKCKAEDALFCQKDKNCSVPVSSKEETHDSLEAVLKKKYRSSLDIDDTLNDLRQDDPRLIEIIRKSYLLPPSKLPYNFSTPSPDLRGQINQAMDVYYNYFDEQDDLSGRGKKQENGTERKTGFFVEAGAHDGEFISNSLLFELKLLWSGLLVEPDPFSFKRLLAKNRKAWSINACLSRKNYPQVVDFDVSGLLGGIVENDMKPSERNGARRKYFDKLGKERQMAKMQCFPLYSILKAIGKTKVDYFSLDVEGSEYHIMESLFEREAKGDFEFSVASVETAYLTGRGFYKSLTEFEYLLRRNGYVSVKQILYDNIYAKKGFF